jgi:hypothetical protein
MVEGSREAGHDLSTVSKITADFGPFLLLAYSFESTSSLDCLFEFVEIQWSFIHTGKAIEVSTVLPVEFGQLVQVIQVCSSSLSRVS